MTDFGPSVAFCSRLLPSAYDCMFGCTRHLQEAPWNVPSPSTSLIPFKFLSVIPSSTQLCCFSCTPFHRHPYCSTRTAPICQLEEPWRKFSVPIDLFQSTRIPWSYECKWRCGRSNGKWWRCVVGIHYWGCTGRLDVGWRWPKTDPASVRAIHKGWCQT